MLFLLSPKRWNCENWIGDEYCESKQFFLFAFGSPFLCCLVFPISGLVPHVLHVFIKDQASTISSASVVPSVLQQQHSVHDHEFRFQRLPPFKSFHVLYVFCSVSVCRSHRPQCRCIFCCQFRLSVFILFYELNQYNLLINFPNSSAFLWQYGPSSRRF